MAATNENQLPDIIKIKGIKLGDKATKQLKGNPKWKTTNGETFIYIPEKYRKLRRVSLLGRLQLVG